MGSKELKSLITSFAPDGQFLSILYPNGKAKIWSTTDGSLLAEWNQPDGEPVSYSCMACSFVGKKGKKEHATLLLALGTNEGDIFAIDVFTGVTRWKSRGCHPGGFVGLAFANKGRSLHSVGINGMAYEMNTDSGEQIRELKASKKPISSLAFSSDNKILAVAGSKTRIISLENGKELLKFADDLGPVQHLSISNNAKSMVTSGFGEKKIHLWRCDLSSRSASVGLVLSMHHPALAFECKNYGEEWDDGLVVLAISETGVVYVWNLKIISQDVVTPTKITVKGNETETRQQESKSAKKSYTSIFAARLQAFNDEDNLTALIAYGSIDSPQFSLVHISNPGKNIVVTSTDEIGTVLEIGSIGGTDVKGMESEAIVGSTQNIKTKKKRAASDMNLAATGHVTDTDNGEAMDGVLIEYDANEPTMGEKLASLNLQDNDKTNGLQIQESSPDAKPPSADSVNILLKQALHADDHALLLDCLYTQDEKVISNSISQLNPSDVLKLLHCLLSFIQSRGAILACVLPWLRSLLLQHSSGIMSQDSSLHALNSLYQIIESRVSTFQSALQLSTYIDFLYAGEVDHALEENETTIPVIYEDDDGSDEEESEDAMETDQDSKEEEEFNELDDIEGSDSMGK